MGLDSDWEEGVMVGGDWEAVGGVVDLPEVHVAMAGGVAMVGLEGEGEVGRRGRQGVGRVGGWVVMGVGWVGMELPELT